jgi:hypothetical protein
MEAGVRLLLEQVIDDLVKLETVLFFHRCPSLIESADGVAHRLQRKKREITAALEALAASGLLERFVLGEGRHVIYSFTEDPRLQEAVSRLSRYFHEDPRLRVEIVKHIMGLTSRSPSSPPRPKPPPEPGRSGVPPHRS